MNQAKFNPSSTDIFNRVSKIRYEIADRLLDLVETLKQGELAGEKASGKLELEREIEDLIVAGETLSKGRFRLLVLGDINRGKSTLINALIGENLLPSDVNPCTALLTVLRHGKQKKVTVYFKGEESPQYLDFDNFKQQYTINPDEAKKLEEENKLAFPNVEYAVVEYPLPLLEKGIEIIDSPGLNDTEVRNKLSLSYIHNCQAILFVFKAIQPFTLEERRYLENYLKGRGLTIFFLINAWDEIRKELLDIDDSEELQEAEEKLRQVFYTNLSEYCQLEGQDIYERRVFEVSSLNALRKRLKNPEDSLEGTGFPEFLAALSTFLTQERAAAEFRQGTILAQRAYRRTQEAIERRIPLLANDVNELKQKIAAVEPEFNQLQEIRDRFQNEIKKTGKIQAKSLADSCRDYILNLGNTFEADFLRYQPDLGFLDFLSQGKREAFNATVKQAFERYLNEKMSAWELTAERELEAAFSQLATTANKYGIIYQQVMDSLSEKLIEKSIHWQNFREEDEPADWAKWAMGFFSLATGNIAGVALAAAGFDWKNIFVNWLGVLGISSFLLIFTGTFLGPIGIALTSLGIGALQAEQARQEFLRMTKKEFSKALPQFAEEQGEVIHQSIQDCFEHYEQEVVRRIDDDIKSRKAELENLLEQKQSREINREQEVNRLKELDAKLLGKVNQIEYIHDNFLLFSA
jgi:GTPase SAR1 family protein